MTTKTKRRICSWITFISFFLMLGIGGSVECETMSLAKGMILMFSCLAVGAAAAYKGGYMQ